jgi:succinyl-CoA synthetase beta subunit
MKLHEYQAKELFSAYGVPVPRGKLITNPWQAYDAAVEIGGERLVVKAQIHAGGRGKAGGVKLAHGAEEAAKLAEEMFGRVLVTPQTGPAGKKVGKILLTEAVDIEKEYYLAILVDRTAKKPAIMASAEGGVEIEQVAARSPEKIILEHGSFTGDLPPFTARKIAYGLGFTGKQAGACTKMIQNLYRLFFEKDCSLVEVNPLVLTKQGDLLAVDAKAAIDDNALARHPELRGLRDFDEEEPLEILARRYGVDYVKLDGRIGCMVNGAGLAMATMDLIKLNGGEPANFLDIKGGANKQNVINAFKLLTADERVEAVLINIFGGIVRCDMVASGILEAMKEIAVKAPIVVRIEGTNAAEGRRILKEADYPFIVADSLADAARKVVAALPGGKR